MVLAKVPGPLPRTGTAAHRHCPRSCYRAVALPALPGVTRPLS
jgi:hypothetical protein